MKMIKIFTIQNNLFIILNYQYQILLNFMSNNISLFSSFHFEINKLLELLSIYFIINLIIYNWSTFITLILYSL